MGLPHADGTDFGSRWSALTVIVRTRLVGGARLSSGSETFLIKSQIAWSWGIDNGVPLALFKGILLMASMATCCDAFGTVEVLGDRLEEAIEKQKIRCPSEVLRQRSRQAGEERPSLTFFLLVKVYPGV